jgi:hypothetical protein
MHGSGSKIPTQKSRQASLRGGLNFEVKGLSECHFHTEISQRLQSGTI